MTHLDTNYKAVMLLEKKYLQYYTVSIVSFAGESSL